MRGNDKWSGGRGKAIGLVAGINILDHIQFQCMAFAEELDKLFLDQIKHSFISHYDIHTIAKVGTLLVIRKSLDFLLQELTFFVALCILLQVLLSSDLHSCSYFRLLLPVRALLCLFTL